MNRLAFTTKIILGLAVITLTVTYFSLPWEQLFQSPKNSRQNILACTKEAKACPDGSSVGRVPPRCEFVPCPSTNVVVVDSRPLLDNTTKNRLQRTLPDGACSLKFNSEPASTSTIYEGRGIFLHIPYNLGWGTTDYRIAPYDLISDSNGDLLQFGSIGSFEGCGFARDYSLRFLPARTADLVISDLRRQYSGRLELLPVTPTKVMINDLIVVKYETAGLCNYPTLEIVGRSYNYELTPLCSNTFDEIETIVRTAKLVN